MHNQKQQQAKYFKEYTVVRLFFRWVFEGINDINIKGHVEIVKKMVQSFPECGPFFMRVLRFKARDFIKLDDFVDLVKIFGAHYAESFADIFQSHDSQLIQEVDFFESRENAIRRIYNMLPSQKDKIFITVLRNLRATFIPTRIGLGMGQKLQQGDLRHLVKTFSGIPDMDVKQSLERTFIQQCRELCQNDAKDSRPASICIVDNNDGDAKAVPPSGDGGDANPSKCVMM